MDTKNESECLPKRIHSTDRRRSVASKTEKYDKTPLQAIKTEGEQKNVCFPETGQTDVSLTGRRGCENG